MLWNVSGTILCRLWVSLKEKSNLKQHITIFQDLTVLEDEFDILGEIFLLILWTLIDLGQDKP